MKAFVFLILLIPYLSNAAPVTDGAVSTGLANTGIAAVQPSDSLLTNPAAMAHLTGIWFTGGSSAYETSGNRVNENYFSLSENSFDSMVPAGLLIKERMYKSVSKYYDQDINITAGGFFMPILAAGITLTQRKTVLGNQSWTEHSPSLGLLWTPQPEIGFGVVIRNLNSPSDSVPASSRLNQSNGFGATYLFSNFVRFRADTEHDLTLNSTSTSIGFESFLSDWLLFRAGFGKITPANLERYSAGISFIGPKFNLHYGYQQLRRNPASVMHAVDFNIPF